MSKIACNHECGFKLSLEQHLDQCQDIGECLTVFWNFVKTASLIFTFRASLRKQGAGPSIFEKEQILVKKDCMEYGSQVSAAGDFSN